MMAASVEEERGQSNFKLNLVKRYNLILIPAQIVWGIAPPLYKVSLKNVFYFGGLFEGPCFKILVLRF